MTKEIWKVVPNYPNYMVSNYGNVKSLSYRRSGISKILKQHTNRDGYCCLSLYKQGQAKQFEAHVLVAMAFLGHVPCGLLRVVDHKNHIKFDNRVENLRIITQRKNADRNHIKSGCNSVGVYLSKSGKYLSKIKFKNISVHLGSFVTEEEAFGAYKKALIEIELEVFNPKPTRIPKNYRWKSEINKWEASIRINGKLKYLGCFKTEQEAIDAVAKSKF